MLFARNSLTKMKIGFLTGARSEYGVMRQLIQRVSEDSFFTLVIYATGMHFQQKYGLTINELKADNFGLIVEHSLMLFLQVSYLIVLTFSISLATV